MQIVFGISGAMLMPNMPLLVHEKYRKNYRETISFFSLLRERKEQIPIFANVKQYK
jgi:hypothetical protein